jgi:membrane protein YdbS with pleckstrin-like domain
MTSLPPPGPGFPPPTPAAGRSSSADPPSAGPPSAGRALAGPPPPAGPPSGFVNDRIDVGDLPRLDESTFTPLHPRYRTGRFVLLAVIAASAALAGVAIALVGGRPAVPLTIAALVVLYAIVAAVLWQLEFHRLGYLLRDHDVSVRRGVLTHRVATVPFARVQHVSVRRGPLERLLGLATVDVSSAGPDISVPGLTPDDAERIERLITERSGVDG